MTRSDLEITRDLVARFNHRFGSYFNMPEPFIPEVGARIMSLDDASKKMSKSNPVEGSYIAMLDTPDQIRKKISRATTDSGAEVVYDPSAKPEVSNLMSIYSECSGVSLQEVQARFEGKMYGHSRRSLAKL